MLGEVEAILPFRTAPKEEWEEGDEAMVVVEERNHPLMVYMPNKGGSEATRLLRWRGGWANRRNNRIDKQVTKIISFFSLLLLFVFWRTFKEYPPPPNLALSFGR